jgi:hypothetical protein
MVQWLLKAHGTDSMWWQNSQMYGWAAIFNSVALVSQSGLRALLQLVDPEFVLANIGGMMLLAMTLQTVQVRPHGPLTQFPLWPTNKPPRNRNLRFLETTRSRTSPLASSAPRTILDRSRTGLEG